MTFLTNTFDQKFPQVKLLNVPGKTEDDQVK